MKRVGAAVRWCLGAGLALGAGAVGCASSSTSSTAAPAAQKSLYERLGGKAAITAVVKDLGERIVADPRVAPGFANADMARVERFLIEQICEATGGPCKYTGRDMRTIHTGMDIKEEAFDALVEDLGASLDKFNVPPQEKSELVAAIAATKPDIVGLKDPALAGGPNPHAQASGKGADAVHERAISLTEAAALLEKANSARLRGNRGLAEQLFSSAEIIVGQQAVSDVAPLFREGAPPRITTPTKKMTSSAAQPTTAGNSDADEPEAKPLRGSLSGTITYGGTPAPTDGFAVVTLRPTSRKTKARKPQERVMEQRNRQFAPRILVVPVGSTVTFPNFDPVFHNVFSRSETKPFDLGYYKNGEAREVVFEKEGVARIACNLHSNMEGYVVSVSAPHYAITDASGKFSFRSLAPGKYTIEAWSDRAEQPVSKPIEIKADKNSIALSLVVTPRLGTSVVMDKFGAPRPVKEPKAQKPPAKPQSMGTARAAPPALPAQNAAKPTNQGAPANPPAAAQPAPTPVMDDSEPYQQ